MQKQKLTDWLTDRLTNRKWRMFSEIIAQDSAIQKSNAWTYPQQKRIEIVYN